MLTFKPLARGWFRVLIDGERSERVTAWRAWSMKRQKTRGELRKLSPLSVQRDEYDDVFCPACSQKLSDVAPGIQKCGNCHRKLEVLVATSLRTSKINDRDAVLCPNCRAYYYAHGPKEIKCSGCQLRFKAIKPDPSQSERVRVSIEDDGYVNCPCGAPCYAGQSRALICWSCRVELEAVSPL